MQVRLTGGLGNTMFQYAFGVSVAKYRYEEVNFDWSMSTWEFALDKIVREEIPVVELGEANHLSQIYHEPCFEYDPKVYEVPNDTYFYGYWQTPKYWDENLIRQAYNFELKNYVQFSSAARQIGSERTSVFIHVRRGDYLNKGTKEFHGELDLSYYMSAVAYMRSKLSSPVFYVFSDDKNLTSFLGFPVLDVPDQIDALHLMTMCDHAIIANSTFSWWGAWLGEATRPDKIVVAPKQWFTDPSINTNDLIPPNWTRL